MKASRASLDQARTISWPPIMMVPERCLDADQSSQRGRLAGAVRADEADDFARCHMKREVVDGREGAVGFGEGLYADHRSRVFSGPGATTVRFLFENSGASATQVQSTPKDFAKALAPNRVSSAGASPTSG